VGHRRFMTHKVKIELCRDERLELVGVRTAE
jgi:hypothetical protein